jgi:hypothetical protein
VTNILHDERTISLINHYLYLKKCLLFSFCTPSPQLAAVSPPTKGGGGWLGELLTVFRLDVLKSEKLYDLLTTCKCNMCCSSKNNIKCEIS